jgi:hypothetical protein
MEPKANAAADSKALSERWLEMTSPLPPPLLRIVVTIPPSETPRRDKIEDDVKAFCSGEKSYLIVPEGVNVESIR